MKKSCGLREYALWGALVSQVHEFQSGVESCMEDCESVLGRWVMGFSEQYLSPWGSPDSRRILAGFLSSRGVLCSAPGGPLGVLANSLGSSEVFGEVLGTLLPLLRGGSGQDFDSAARHASLSISTGSLFAGLPDFWMIYRMPGCGLIGRLLGCLIAKNLLCRIAGLPGCRVSILPRSPDFELLGCKRVAKLPGSRCGFRRARALARARLAGASRYVLADPAAREQCEELLALAPRWFTT